MEKPRFKKFFCVLKNETGVIEVSLNDFKLQKRSFLTETSEGATVDVLCAFPNKNYSLLPDNEMYYGYESKARAMEMAKAGALKHLTELIAEGDSGAEKVHRYRFEHYDDLNVRLIDSNIRLVKKTLN
jgi:hypothetical protein